MKTIEAIRAINDIASSQRGLFTTAQAGVLGVERYTLSRLERFGNIERLAKGVYRMGGSPSVREEDVLAAWLSIDPRRRPGDISAESAPVAMGATAAWLYGIGEIGPSPYEFCTPERKQTKRPNLILRKRRLDPKDVAIVSGVPATKPGRTVVDLIDSGEDLSLVANVLADALGRGLVEDEGELRESVDARGSKVGMPAGASLYDALAKRRDEWRTRTAASSTGS